MKEFFERVRELGNAPRADLIEKDYHIHRILRGVSQNDYLRSSFLFKGGTCLAKAYLGYYRFSVDVDFTWADQSAWEDMTPSKARRTCSEEIYRLIDNVKQIADDIGLELSPDKSDRKNIKISAGGRIATLFMRYDSEVLSTSDWIKFEVNFVDLLLYPPQRRALSSYAQDVRSNELMFLFKEPFNEYITPIELDCYGPLEIFLEKCRAAITRKVFKYRDLVDIHLLKEKMGIEMMDHSQDIIEKTRYMLDLYRKYRENIELRTITPEDIAGSEENSMLIAPITPGIQQGAEMVSKELNEIREMVLRG